MEVNEQENGTPEAILQKGVLTSEADLAEKDDALVHEEEEVKPDYIQFSKKQLAELAKELAKDNNPIKAENVLREIKPYFEDLYEKNKSQALEKFIAEGGLPVDFEFRGDEWDAVFDANAKLIRDRKNQFIRQQEEARNENLKKKEGILEQMRILLDAPGSGNQYDKFQELQKQWKSVGTVSGNHSKTIWANYHALVDRFYDNQSIYFELKELDRKKNLQAKKELITKAKLLAQVESVKEAIKELNELHHEFKHIGPVPKEEKEAIWQEFKKASDSVYERRDSFVKEIQQQLQTNLDAKTKLAESVATYATFLTDRIKEWNTKTTELLELQKQWEKVGSIPRSKAKEVNKKFWSSFKLFFQNKATFFKKLDEERSINLKAKQALLAKAKELVDAEDIDKAIKEVKSLQAMWKETGPVPEKVREKIFKEFKEHCDAVFTKKRGQQSKHAEDQQENFIKKQDICNQLEAYAAEGKANIEDLDKLQESFNAIGFVPRDKVQSIRDRFHQALQTYVNSIPNLGDTERGQLSLKAEFSDVKNDPNADKKLQQKELQIRKKISKAENDVALLRNNLEFFAKSKNAGSLREDVNKQIAKAEAELRELKNQLKLIRSL
ncbi:MAG: DUF349 domain-containing protein [Chryseotalea sp.]